MHMYESGKWKLRIIYVRVWKLCIIICRSETMQMCGSENCAYVRAWKLCIHMYVRVWKQCVCMGLQTMHM